MSEIEIVKLIEEIQDNIAESKRIHRKAIRELEDVEEKLNRVIEKIA